MEEDIQKENIVLEITLLQDPDDKGWTAFIGNCISEGSTKQEATENLKHIILTVIKNHKIGGQEDGRAS